MTRPSDISSNASIIDAAGVAPARTRSNVVSAKELPSSHFLASDVSFFDLNLNILTIPINELI